MSETERDKSENSSDGKVNKSSCKGFPVCHKCIVKQNKI